MHWKDFIWPIAASVAWISVDQFVEGSIKIGAVATVVIFPIYQKWRSVKTEADTKERESRRKDCDEELKRAKREITNRDSRIRDLERQCKEWKNLFDNSGSRDHPKMG